MSLGRAAGIAVPVAIVVAALIVRSDDDFTLLRGDLVRWVETLSDNRSIAVLMGIPAVFIALEYARTQYQLLHTKSAHRMALARLRRSAQDTRST